MELATGRQGKPHITSQQDRQKHQGIFGDGAYILNTGNMLEPEVQSSNKIHIKDGALMFQGALFTVKVGTYDEVTINNGNQGMKRKDLIVARYTYDSASNIEAGEWAVIQGTPAADNPVVPEVTSGDIQAGDNVVECPVFVVNLDGINVTGVDIIPETMWDMSTINAYLSELNSKTLQFSDIRIINIDSLPNNGTKSVLLPEDITNLAEWIIISASISSGWGSYSIPNYSISGEANNVEMYIYNSTAMPERKEIVIKTKSSWNGYTGTVIIGKLQ